MSWKTPYPGLFCTFAFWLVLFLLGWPMPTGDDIFFLGAAFNLATTGTFTNPHTPEIASLGATDNFFVYTPLQPYVLALWLKIFGISRVALASFHGLTCAIAGFALFDLVRPYVKWPILFAFSLNLAVAIFLSLRGFRPDALGLALFAIGLRLVVAESLLAWFSFNLALFLSVLASPLFGSLTLIAIFYSLFLRVGSFSSGFRPILLRLGLVIAAGAAAFLLFLGMIDFRLLTFLSVFNKARQVAGSFSLAMLQSDPRYLLKLFIQIILPAICLLALLGFAKGGSRYFTQPLRNGALLALLVAGLGVFLNMFSSASGENLFNFAFVVFCFFLASQLQARYQPLAAGICVAFLALYFLSFGRLLTQNLQLVFSPVPDNSSQIQAQLDALKPAHIYIDSAAADRFYHYHLPANVDDIVFGVGDKWTTPYHPREDFPPGSVMVISTQFALHYAFTDLALQQNHMAHRPMRLLGKLYPETEANPYDLVLVDTGKQ